jgi:hypothetical protein
MRVAKACLPFCKDRTSMLVDHQRRVFVVMLIAGE